MKNYMPIASFDEASDAANLAVHLRHAGFDAEMRDESSEQIFIHLKIEPRAQFKVVVPSKECETAIPYLDRMLTSGDPLIQHLFRCPECGSTRVEFPQFSRNTLLGAVGPAIISLTGMIPPQFFCQSCQYTWDPEETLVANGSSGTGSGSGSSNGLGGG